MQIGNREFLTSGKTYIMGILNVTPDSFSDGGRWNQLDEALRHVEDMLNEGMDVVDVGGESTRPGYTKISDQEEIDRVAPVIEAIKARFDVPVSLDTYKSAVARAGVAAGADLILADACFSEEDAAKRAGVHMSASQTAGLLREAGAGRLLRTHRFGGGDADPCREGGTIPADLAQEMTTYDI